MVSLESRLLWRCAPARPKRGSPSCPPSTTTFPPPGPHVHLRRSDEPSRHRALRPGPLRSDGLRARQRPGDERRRTEAQPELRRRLLAGIRQAAPRRGLEGTAGPMARLRGPRAPLFRQSASPRGSRPRGEARDAGDRRRGRPRRSRGGRDPARPRPARRVHHPGELLLPAGARAPRGRTRLGAHPDPRARRAPRRERRLRPPGRRRSTRGSDVLPRPARRER